MRIVSDMEYRLRVTAVDPPHRQGHYDALLGELRARHRIRNRKPYIFVAALLACLVVFQSPPLESFNYRFEYVVYGDDGSVCFKPYEDSHQILGFSRTVDGERVIVDEAQAEAMREDWEIAEELFMAGQLDLYFVTGTTPNRVSYFTLQYRGEMDGKVYKHSEFTEGPETLDLVALYESPEYMEAILANAEDHLDPLPAATRELDGHKVRFRRASFTHPTFGEVDLWISTDIN